MVRDAGTEDGDRWRDGTAPHWCGTEGPSKVENLDIIAGSAGRSGNPIRSPRNALKASATTSADSDWLAFFPPSLFSFCFWEGQGSAASSVSSGKYQTSVFLIIPPGTSSLVYPSFWRPYLWSGPVLCTRTLHPGILTFVQTDFHEKLLLLLLCGITFVCWPIKKQEMTVSVCNAGISFWLLDGEIFLKKRKNTQFQQKSTINQCCIYFFLFEFEII